MERAQLCPRLEQRIDTMMQQGWLDDAIRDAKTATRRYGKRQVTWFKNQTPNTECTQG